MKVREDVNILSAVLEQATNLTQDLAVKLKHIVVDLGFRGVDAAIGHLKSDHRMDRCWLQGVLGDALHSISCAAGYNLRCLLRAIARMGIGAVFLRLLQAALPQRQAVGTSYDASGRVWTASMSNWIGNVVVKKLIFGHAVQGAF